MDESQVKALREPFPPALIGKLPKGNGVTLDYVGHAAVTDRLLAVDPDWTWQPMSTDPVSGAPVLDAENNLWILLTICGKTLPCVGDGRSMKERISDALRNGAMRFGVALDLWSKEDLQATRTSQIENEKTISTRPASLGMSSLGARAYEALVKLADIQDPAERIAKVANWKNAADDAGVLLETTEIDGTLLTLDRIADTIASGAL